MKRIICVAPSRALGRKKRTRPSRSRSPDATRRSPYEAGGVPRAPRSSTPDAPQRRSALGAATYAPSPGGPPTAPRHDAPRRDLLTRAPSARRAHETPQGKLMSWPWTHPFSRPGPPSIPVRFKRCPCAPVCLRRPRQLPAVLHDDSGSPTNVNELSPAEGARPRERGRPGEAIPVIRALDDGDPLRRLADRDLLIGNPNRPARLDHSHAGKPRSVVDHLLLARP